MARISDLDKITDPNDSNVFPISDGLTTKKITYLDLKTAITTQATNNRLGTVKVGNGLAIADDGTLSVQNFQGYSLPPATNSQLGGVIIGSGFNISETGVLSTSYTLPVATPTVLGGIKVGEGLTISNGILSTIPIFTDEFDDSGITIGNESDFRFYVENSNTPTIKDDVNGVIVLSVRDTSMAGNLADIRLLARNMTVGQGDETAPALVPDFSGQPMNLGTPSLKWSKVYANSFIGNVTGTASKSTEADSLLVGVDYLPASTSAITDTIVARDSIGNINANNFIGNLTGNVTGNSSTATQLQTSRSINGQPFNGTQDITVTASTPFALTRGSFLVGGSATFNGSAASTWSVNATSSSTPNTVVSRDSNGDFLASTITASNFIGPVTGNVTGTLFGNSTTATRLQTPRKINGVDFDGTTDIQLPSNSARVDELAGSIKMWGSPTPPANWLLCNGQSVSKLIYPTLFSRIGYQYGGNGNFFNLPNLINKFPVGAGDLYSANSQGGSKDASVVAHTHSNSASSTFTGNNLPNHTHGFSATIGTAPNHSHGYVDRYFPEVAGLLNASYVTNKEEWPSGYNGRLGSGSADRDNAGWLTYNAVTNAAGGHTHTLTTSINSSSAGVASGSVSTSVSINSTGVSGTDANLPPYIGVYYIIKASDDGSGGGTLQAGAGIDIQTSGPFSIISSTVNTSTFLPTTGGTMSGFLTLHSNPSNANHAATKSYVDNQIATIPSSNDKLPLTGGSLSGSLFLHAKPTSALQAATKNYVDDRINLIANSSVRQIKTKTIGYGSQTYWSGGVSNYQTGGRDAQAIQTIVANTPQIVRAPFNNILEVEIYPLSLDSLFKIDCTIACTATYVTFFQIRKSINGGPFNPTISHQNVTNYGYNGTNAPFGHGLRDVNHVHFVRDVTAVYMENVCFTFIDPVLPQVGQTIRYRLYACSQWANVAYTLIINNRAPHYDMPNYSTMTVTEFLP